MNSKIKIIKILAAGVFGILALSLMTGRINSPSRDEFRQGSYSSSPTSQAAALPSSVSRALEVNQPNSTPLAYLFQIMFFLFFLSPPVIAVMLFLIWKELKAKNKLK